MNDLLNTTANITRYTDDRDPFAAFAASGAQPDLIGKPFRFVKGDFTIGDKDEKEIVPLASTMLAIMPLLLRGWVRWWGDKPGTKLFARVGFRECPPARISL